VGAAEVRIGEPWQRMRRARRLLADAVKVRADRSGETGVLRGAFEARPAEVPQDRGRAIDDFGNEVDLLPHVLPDVAEPDLAGAGPEGEAERVAQAVGDDPARVRPRIVREWIAGRAVAALRIDADDGAVEPDIVAGVRVPILYLQPLRAQRAAVVASRIGRLQRIQWRTQVRIVGIA